MSPIRMPFDISSAKKPRVSDMRGDSPLDVLDPHAGADGRLAPVFVGDRRRELDLVPTRIEGADDRAELQLVLDELRREGRAVIERAHVLGAVDDDEVPARIDEPGVAGVEPALSVDDLSGRLLVLEITLEDAGALDQHLAAVGDPHVDARARAARRRGIGL